MYRRPKFLEVLIRIREEMAREADYDTDLFAELVRSGRASGQAAKHSLAEQASDEAEPTKARKRART